MHMLNSPLFDLGPGNIYIYIYIFAHDVYICTKTSLKLPIMGLIINGLFREVVGLGSQNTFTICIAWAIIWDQNKTVATGEWSICGGGRLESFIYMK